MPAPRCSTWPPSTPPPWSPKMVGRGSQYAWGDRDSNGDYFDGAKRYRLRLPADAPAKDFWSVVVYDPQTRSELQTSQPFPVAITSRTTSPSTRTVRSICTSDLTRPTAWSRTGSKQSPARDGSVSCGFTAPSSPGSTRRGGPASSSRFRKHGSTGPPVPGFVVSAGAQARCTAGSTPHNVAADATELSPSRPRTRFVTGSVVACERHCHDPSRTPADSRQSWARWCACAWTVSTQTHRRLPILSRGWTHLYTTSASVGDSGVPKRSRLCKIPISPHFSYTNWVVVGYGRVIRSDPLLGSC